MLAEKKEEELGKFCVVCRLLTNHNINFMAFKQTMASVWHPVKRMIAKELGNNCYLIQFFHQMDLDRIMKHGPWTFSNN